MEVPRYWRLRRSYYRLEGSNCQECGIKHFPERRICPECGHDNDTPVKKISENVVNINPSAGLQNGN